MKQSNRKTPIVFGVGLVLLCVTVLTSHLTCGLYARYATSAVGGDSARVAKFEIGENFTSDSTLVSVSLKPGAKVEKTVTVSNTSEVTVYYEIKAENITDNLKIEFVTQPGELAPGASVDAKLVIKWIDGEISSQYAGMVDLIRITVSAVQSD